MGDRGNIAVLHDKDNQVWLYSHWGGSELFKRLQGGLAFGKGRWGDDSYLNRIIFCHAIPEGQFRDETGYGISTRMQDNEYPILVVDLEHKSVFVIQEDELKDGQVPAGFTPKEKWGFQQFIDLKKDVRKELVT